MTQMPNRTDAEMVTLMEQAFSSVEELCSALDAVGWPRETDCPGWSVKDQLAHVSSFEAVASGTPRAPEVDLSHLPRVTNDFQRAIEREVEARRAWAPAKILDEFRDSTRKRLTTLRALDDAGWESEVPSPVGVFPQRGILGIRILDVFFHEQDIRRAAERPGHLDGDVARYVVQRMVLLALPHVLALSHGPTRSVGTTLRIQIDGVAGCTATLEVTDGKGVVTDNPVADATLTTEVETFLCLIGGRWKPERAHTEGRIKIEGDEILVGRVLDHIVVVP